MILLVQYPQRCTWTKIIWPCGGVPAPYCDAPSAVIFRSASNGGKTASPSILPSSPGNWHSRRYILCRFLSFLNSAVDFIYQEPPAGQTCWFHLQVAVSHLNTAPVDSPATSGFWLGGQQMTSSAVNLKLRLNDPPDRFGLKRNEVEFSKSYRLVCVWMKFVKN